MCKKIIDKSAGLLYSLLQKEGVTAVRCRRQNVACSAAQAAAAGRLNINFPPHFLKEGSESDDLFAPDPRGLEEPEVVRG